MTTPDTEKLSLIPTPTPALRALSYATVAFLCAWPLLEFVIYNYALMTSEKAAVIGVVFLSGLAFATGVLFVTVRILGTSNAPRCFLAAYAVIIIFFSFPQIMEAARWLFGLLGLFLPPHFGYMAVFIGAPLFFLIFGNHTVLLKIAFAFSLAVVGATVVELSLITPRGEPTDVRAGEPDSPRPVIPAVGNSVPKTPLPSISVGGTGKDEKARGDGRYRPNVYNIVLDGYARADQLKTVFGFDNTPFLKALAEHGFRIDPLARSNYPQSRFSFASFLSMGYPYSESDKFSDYSRLYAILNGINATIQNAWARGYRYIHIGNGVWGETQCVEHPKIICRTPNPSIIRNKTLEILNSLNRLTPLSYFVSITGKIGHVTTVSDVQKTVATASFKGPFLLFAHSLPPHSPYTSKADCSDQPFVQFNLSGGLDKDKYLEALQCVNRRLLAFIDYIDEHDPEAIVIFHSDHGSRFLTDWTLTLDAWTEKQFNERFGILFAVRAPGRCMEEMPAGFTLVNLFRFVFACLDGKAPEYLENRHFIVTDTGSIDFGRVYLYPARD